MTRPLRRVPAVHVTSPSARLFVASQADLDQLCAELAASATATSAVGELGPSYREQPSDRERELHRRARHDERRARARLYPRSGRIEVRAA